MIRTETQKNNSVKMLRDELRRSANPAKAKILQGFFKTGKGQYGEGDIFLGITVPGQREISKKYSHLSLGDIGKLIKSKIHEERLVALLILVSKYQKADAAGRAAIYRFYLAHTKWINNWDLVDLSAPKIVGAYLATKPKTVLYRLAKSKNLWERRVAILSTFDDIYHGKAEGAIKISQMLLKDPHDLIHKAVGWMLREVGKRCGEKTLTDFLNKHYRTMPRTMLRYAIERLDGNKKRMYMAKG